MYTGFGGLHRIMLIMYRAGRTSQIEDPINLNIEWKRHVVAHQLEVMAIKQMPDIQLATGEKVIDTNDIISGRNQTIAQVTAQETCAPGDQYSSHRFPLSAKPKR
jgi:hypothetical protein